MNYLEERILAEGTVKPGNVLKVDAFLNHQLDIGLLRWMGGRVEAPVRRAAHQQDFDH